ncbi:MAG: hypothetical protein KDC98_05480 [Planctomycetes bacterium]|nr:hypothetical protein [Planctomycetota bacterium]
MNTILRGTASLLALSSLLLCAQETARSARSKGAIYKNEVDGLIGVLRDTARHAGLESLGGDSVLDTAKILTAMGHCHRRYHSSDGPVVRPSLAFLIKSRQADGSFGDAVATAWTIEAFERMDADGYKEEVGQARRWGEQHGAIEGFGEAVARVIEQVRADVWPQQLGDDAAAKARIWIQKPEALDRSAAAEALVQLTACQAANRELDRLAHENQGSDAFTSAQQKAFAAVFAQQKDGVFMRDPAMTGFGLLALQTKPKAKRTEDEQTAITKGLKWLCGKQNADGTFGDRLPNYTTCVVVAALARWDDASKKPVLDKAQKAILAFQNIEANGYEQSDRDYGSIGYGSSQRGDLSNLHFSLEALKATGLDENHEAFTKAIVFLQRTQNLKSHNDFSGKVPDPEDDGKILDATSGDDGGATYYPGNSNAGYLVQPDGKSVARSYGSMTYALLKAYTFAGVKGDDPRVQGAVRWIRNNWDLATNPGADPALGEKVKYQGLFYYYMVLAQALDVAGIDTVDLPGDGSATVEKVDWRKALAGQLEGMQLVDGTWINGKNDRWMEGMPLLCTCYAMVALERCNR